MKPVAALAVAVFAAFFMSWFTAVDPTGRTKFQGSMTGLDIALSIPEVAKAATAAKKPEEFPREFFGVKIEFYVWALPVLALLTVATSRVQLVSRAFGVLTGLYPLAWIGFAIAQIPQANREKALKAMGEQGAGHIGVGIYVILLSSILLIVVGSLGIGSSDED
jgi:hypothetical protein